MNLQEVLVAWFAKNRRNYLWRNEVSPYKVMISEFMLQRTRAEQVVPVFEEFIRRYPQLSSLSDAGGQDVSRILSPLGLRWRSDHFIKAAQFITREYGGTFPESASALLEIPGVGDYIAGAILTICFGVPYPVIDSNIARFLNRFHGLNLKGEMRRKRVLIEKAHEFFTSKEPGTLLYSILDFTSKVCILRAPKCDSCCLRDICSYEVSWTATSRE
ncbi:hypothetical protein V511_12755 [Mesotoga sp. Brook.08.YT.4.2.5.1]|uniref:DNA glycosylase n=1 Tax=unclassified Mesotoga TaxID=1184398 RepID=UPI000C9B54BC|nr:MULTISPECIES: DNA glycosylase [unclassified Mesotoga]PNE18213.1 hypothetical protein V511_12755 [Mesotoga sp. Brook.08.YT.4.2.5.1]RAO96981.1 hypothetical protein M388_12335 [Mesotoga sp. Brook.08.YT.4.2.5.4.]RDI90408.1 hypothetical protein Q502_13795 [Mesotoga sp. Brook.08.YT.4.2.5.2.]